MADRTIASGRIKDSSKTSLTIDVSGNLLTAEINSDTELETNLDIGNHVTAYINLGKNPVATKIQAYDPNRRLV